MMGNDGDDACALGNHVDHLFEHLWLTTPHARLRASVGTGEQAYHEQVWSVALALATIKGMVGRPHDRAIQACEELDQASEV